MSEPLDEECELPLPRQPRLRQRAPGGCAFEHAPRVARHQAVAVAESTVCTLPTIFISVT